jgi:hypothetical protein
MRCPRCRSDQIYLSYSGTDRIPRLLRPFLVCGRCYSCGKKIYRFRLGRFLFRPGSGVRWAA